MNPGAVLAARSVVMQYGGTRALDGVDFEVHGGKVSVLVGENGAGKSTLMRILAGEEQPTAGHLEMDGRPVRIADTRDAAARGIAMIHQELNLLPNLSVAENIFLGRERTRYGIIDRREQERITRGLMDRLEQLIDPKTPAGDLPLGQQQILEIAKAIAQDVRVLITDEPTSAISAAEVEILFRLIRDLKAHGVSVVYISHRLDELLQLGDRITILRDGRVVAESATGSATVPWLVETMTGRGAAPVERAASSADGRVTLAADRLSLGIRLHEISFTARAGEIVGFYGLLGAGRTELFETLIGLRHADSGSIQLEGRPLERLDIADRIARGLVLVPEERQSAGIVPTGSVLENMMLGAGGGWYVSLEADHRRAGELVRGMSIRSPGLNHPITALSGGNQQKVVLARSLLRSPNVLLLDEPTRGVDVGAREEIHGIIRSIAAEGRTVLFASSELQEVQALATRILVMSGGRITGEFTATAATEQALVAASAPLLPQATGGDSAYR